MNAARAKTTTRQPASPFLVAALAYAARGVPVFPCIPRDKRPACEHGLLDATWNVEQIRAWWKTWPHANIGVPTGRASGWLAIDIDTKNGATYDTLAALGPLPKTLTAQTASGGLHLIFRYPETTEVRNSASKIAGGVDVRGEGGYIVVAPSRRAEGQYEWVSEDDVEVAECPRWLIELATAKPKVLEPTTTRKPLAKVKKGDRDGHWLNWALARARLGTADITGFELAQQLLLDSGVRDSDAVLREYARQATFNASDPFTDADVARWLSSAASSQLVMSGEPARNPNPTPSPTARAVLGNKPEHKTKAAVVTQAAPAPRREDGARTEPTRDRPALRALPPAGDGNEDEPPTGEDETSADGEHTTDLGNARRFVKLHSDRARYVSAWDRWYVWDGTRWRHDTTDEAARFAKATVRTIYREAADATDDLARRDLVKWATRSESEARIRAMLNLAQSESELAIDTDAFDKAQWLLNCRNGTLDLRSGRLMEHMQSDLITKRADVDYDANAQCPTWLGFLDTIFAGNAELIAYVQRACGYALTGDTSEQCFFILHGNGANGKSTFLDIWARILGDYASTTPTDTLMEKRGQSIPSDVARLVGARFVMASEAGEGRRLDEEFVKRATGSERVPARFMHKEWFDFYPVFKLFLAVNHRPTIRGTDRGIWRRVHLWPFDVTIPPERQDKHLGRKLMREAPGILAWAVAGCLAWREHGLQPPTIVQEAVDTYQRDMDVFAGFIADECLQKPTALVTAKQLNNRYHEWCERNGEHELSATRLGTYLRERLGCKACRDTHGARAWVGLGLRFDA